MNKIGFKVLVLVVMAFAFSIIVSAQATRTWVSGVGDDVNPCSRTAPCKTFGGAISKTATNGEISCLDPAGYGAVTITKSITIDCEDTQGSILASSVTGMTINITSATDTRKSVRIRGLSINGANTGIHGIRVLSALVVNVEDTVIDGFTQHGISIESTTSPKITVNKTFIRNNVGNGINSFISAGTVNLAVSNSQISNTATGINLSSNTKATVSDSTMSNNTNGVLAFQADLAVFSSTVSGNTTGVVSQSGGNVRISGNLITSNGTGLSTSGGGSIISFSTNVLAGNTIDGSPTGFGSLN